MHNLKKQTSLPVTAPSDMNHAASARNRVDQLFREQTPIALFLDIDGTLLDISLTPATVHVPPGLTELLGVVAARLSGAVALVTGRKIAEADDLLQPMKFIAAGVHGAEMRTTVTGEIKPLTPSFSPDLFSDIQAAAISMPGIVMEDKGTGIAMHYRLAPELRDPLLMTLKSLVLKYPAQFSLCEGRKVVEILPVGFSKGRALSTLATLPEFTNRVPIMIGDDIADIGAFGAAEDLGGYGLRVAGEHFSKNEAAFSGPKDVLGWLAQFA